MNNYQPNFGNPMFYGMYGMNPMQGQVPPQPQRYQPPMEQQFNQPTYKQNIGLQGKSVDSIDVVKAMDIPLDGSISYFPLTNGTAIITKQLQQDGTSKTVVYEPVKEEQKKQEEKTMNYLTKEDLNIFKENNNSLKNEMGSIKNQIEEISGNITQLINEMRNFKGGRK
jgi:hypothetical protein